MIKSLTEYQGEWGRRPGSGRRDRVGLDRLRLGAVCLMVILLTLWNGPAWCQGDTPLDGRLALDYAHRLLSQGDVKGAEGELKRFLFFCPLDGRAGEARELLASLGQGPKGATDEPEAGQSGETAGGGRVAGAVIRFYQDHLRTFRSSGSSCPSYPSCSAYSLQAVEKHGAFLGTFIFIDRFWREVTTAGQPPFVMSDGRKLHYDPLENNDYWLAGEEGGSR